MNSYWYVYLGLLAATAIVMGGIPWSGLLYYRLVFPRFYRPRYKEVRKKAAIFIPCKGANERLEKYLLSMVKQDYPDFTVVFATESERDPANEVIRGITAKYPHTKHVVAGLAEGRCQKNHNLLAAIEADGGSERSERSEIYVFCDADILVPQGWLRKLLAPFSDGGVDVTVGFQQMIPTAKSAASTVHAILTAYLGVLLTLFRVRAVWGGSMAVRRGLFERLEVADRWGETVVDDISLMALLRKNRSKVVFVSDCIGANYEAATSFKQLVAWFTRQVQYNKFYLPSFWPMIFTFSVTATVLFFTSPVVAFWAWRGPGPRPVLAMSVAFVAFMLASYSVMALAYEHRQPIPRWVALMPLAQLVAAYSVLRTIRRRHMLWGNVLYEVGKNGVVVSVRREF